MLMPPSVADWLPEDHLAWFVLDVVAELDMSGFRARYRQDGRGGAAYDPQLLLGVLVYAYCMGERSSRKIEKRLIEDVAYRVLAANQQPDHATIARFRAEHQDAIAGLFGQVLAVGANASRDASRTAEQLAEEILAEAAAVDAAEDAAGDAGPAVPAGPGGRGGRRERLRALLAELEAEASERGCPAPR
jgi:transposase